MKNPDFYKNLLQKRGVEPLTFARDDKLPKPWFGEQPPAKGWHSYKGPIRDQGSEGSCAGFGLLKTYEMLKLIKDNLQLNLSERFPYEYGKEFDEIAGNRKTQEGTTLVAVCRCAKVYGLPREEVCPYSPGEQWETTNGEMVEVLDDAEKNRAHDYYSLFRDEPNGDTLLRRTREVLCRGPFLLGVAVTPAFLTPDSDGFIHPRTVDENILGYHALACIGYSNALERYGEIGWLDLLNSWGKDYGFEGICRISYRCYALAKRKLAVSAYELEL